jgi:hypothetical protein
MAARSDQRDQISRLISAKKMGLGPAPAQLIGEREASHHVTGAD